MSAQVGATADRHDERAAALQRYRVLRARTEALAAPLSAEDQTIQSMSDVSPTKWHRAHTSWFFENFLLAPFMPTYRPLDPIYGYLFNSYYEGAGARHPRPERGLLSRPGIAEIAHYRAHVDGAMEELVATASAARWREIAPLLELGINHEEQHQELILMDIKHVLALNPLEAAYAHAYTMARRTAPPLAFAAIDGGVHEIGYGGNGFSFDNEMPRHKVWVEPFRLGSRLATCGEYLAFIEDGGYRQPEWWLSEGWASVQREGWEAPLYWRHAAGAWTLFTLSGRRAVDIDEPVCHVSYYEADAFARWSGKRLPTEAEWEIAAMKAEIPMTGNLLDSGTFHPKTIADNGEVLQQMIGDVWEWTASPYVAYPGYHPPAGVIGEYNGKFMANQMVLRGGAAVTPAGHVRLSYRNFFPPGSRWAFGGIRLAEDVR
jgi:ergothioneine biosynthesis protein EgtB